MRSHLLLRVHKPWGWYEVIYKTHNSLTKLLHIDPDSCTSLQSHAHRTERFFVIDGSGYAIVRYDKRLLKVGDTFSIKKHELHRLGATRTSMTLVEIQNGHCREGDIIRFADRYGRS